MASSVGDYRYGRFVSHALTSGPDRDPIFQDMQEAFEFLTLLRLECQLRQVREGKELGNYVSRDGLTQLQRSLLKKAFRAAARAQALLEERFRTAIWSQLGEMNTELVEARVSVLGSDFAGQRA